MARNRREEGLSIISTANKDLPFELGKKPFLIIDVWEHAYYLKYQSRKPECITNWWKTVNWDKVNELYNEALRS